MSFQRSDFRPPGALLSHLAECCGITRKGGVEDRGGVELHWLDLKGLRLRSSELTPFLIPKALSAHAMIWANQLNRIHTVLPALPRIAERCSRREWSALLVGGELDHGCGSALSRFARDKIAILDRTTIELIYAAKSPADKLAVLGNALTQRLGKKSLSPYQTDVPASGSRFFGRSHLSSELEDGGNFSIIGNRRIGKTSLMHEVRDRLKSTYRPPKIAELYGTRFQNKDELLREMVSQLVDRAAEQNRVLSSQDPDKQIKEVIEELATTCGVAIFIDEVDHVLEFDEEQNFKFFEFMREIFLGRSSSKRFFVAGFRKLMQAKAMGHNPLFNFTQAVYLDRFSLKESREMIQVPLLQLGIDVRQSDIPAHIYNETGGHPELIAVCCAKLIDEFEENMVLPDADDLMKQVFDSQDFRTKVWHAFLWNSEPVEELACYLLIKRAVDKGKPVEQLEFTLSDVMKLFGSVGLDVTPAEADTIMSYLHVASTFCPVVKGSNQFRFSVPQLGRYVQNFDLSSSIELAIRKCKEADLTQLRNGSMGGYV